MKSLAKLTLGHLGRSLDGVNHKPPLLWVEVLLEELVWKQGQLQDL